LEKKKEGWREHPALRDSVIRITLRRKKTGERRIHLKVKPTVASVKEKITENSLFIGIPLKQEKSRLRRFLEAAFSGG
jgi:hypothetical protein